MSTGFPEPVVGQITTRDHGCCAWCGRPVWGERGRDFSVHHRAPRGRGGAGKKAPWVNFASNGVLLHGTGVIMAGSWSCHGQVESDRERATRLGFLVSRNGIARPCDIRIRHAVHGVCLLTDDGLVEGAA